MVVDQMLRRAVRYFPRKAAAVCGDSSFSYRELNERVNRLAAGLANLGVTKGDRVRPEGSLSVTDSYCFASTGWILCERFRKWILKLY